MRILILDTYYPDFLSRFYSQHRDVETQSYAQQWRGLMNACFGTADFYSANLKALGHEAEEIVVNCESLQAQWASEHGLKPAGLSWTLKHSRGPFGWINRRRSNDWLFSVLANQIQHFKPDVLYVQDMNYVPAAFLDEIRSACRMIVGQIACPISAELDLRKYDLVLSSLPHFVSRFRAEGVKSEYLKLGFEPKILGKLRTMTADETSKRVIFVGSLSPHHKSRIKLLERLAKSAPLAIWGYGVDGLPSNSPLRNSYHGQAWALEMYQLLRDGTVALNHHIDLSEGYANNMRLFEVTGAGGFLLTDWKENLGEMFTPGKEVAVYRTTEECEEMIEYYFDHPEERRAIAAAGQRRTLSEHTYRHRMEEVVTILNRYLN